MLPAINNNHRIVFQAAVTQIELGITKLALQYFMDNADFDDYTISKEKAEDIVSRTIKKIDLKLKV
jgi:hypothetical protein